MGLILLGDQFLPGLIFADFVGNSENQQKTETSQNGKLDNFERIYFCRWENKWNFAWKKSGRFSERQGEYPFDIMTIPPFLLLKMT